MALILPETVARSRFSRPPQSRNDDSRTNNDACDVRIWLVADRHRCLWASQVNVRAIASTRASGNGPVGASRHSLLAIGLISALRAISGNRLSKIKSRNGNQTPTVHISVPDSAFAAGIKAFVAEERVDNFKASKSFWHELLKLLRKFKVTVDIAPEDDGRIPALEKWAKDQLVVPKEVLKIPAVFTADAVEQTA